MLKKFQIAAAAAVLFASVGAQAAVTVVKDLSNVDVIPGLTGFSTTGAMMSGMTITATFSEGFTQTLAWSTTGATSGGVTGAGWGLSVTGDTFGAAWNFTIDGQAGLGQLESLALDGAPGLTLFDTAQPSSGTEGSANGLDFAFVSGCSSCDAIATYSHVVAVSPDAAVGDIFHNLTVSFTLGSGPRSDWSFVQDTDNDARLFDVPEPGSIALAGLALLAAGAVRRRQAR